MKMPIDHFTWQLLRAIFRRKGSPMTGRELRLIPSRRTKDGTFLDVLVDSGLLVRLDTIPAAGKDRVQFRTYYALTEKGEYAAEYGEAEFTRKERGLPPLPENQWAH